MEPKLHPKYPSGHPKRRPKSIKNSHQIVSEPPWGAHRRLLEAAVGAHWRLSWGGDPPKYTDYRPKNYPNWMKFGQSMDAHSYSTTKQTKKRRAFRPVFLTFGEVFQQAEYRDDGVTCQPHFRVGGIGR